MSDRVTQTLVGRIFKEPVTTEKAIRVEVVSNLYKRSDDPKDNTYPVYTTIVLTGNMQRLWSTRLAELTKGSKVFAQGDWGCSLFVKKDGTAGMSGSIFPILFEVVPSNRSNSATGTSAPASAPNPNEDELPF